jgi:hypothetical protein
MARDAGQVRVPVVVDTSAAEEALTDVLVLVDRVRRSVTELTAELDRLEDRRQRMAAEDA